MSDTAYHALCETLAKRRGRYPGKDIPEFYALVEELFTPEEAEVYNAIPKGYHPAETIAKALGKRGKRGGPNPGRDGRQGPLHRRFDGGGHLLWRADVRPGDL